MAKQGISTGTAPNDGTGSSLLAGALIVNSNFDEVYGKVGDGTNLYVGIVSSLVAGTNISISTSFGQVTVSADDQEVGIATYADMAGIATAAGIATEAVNCGLSTFATIAGVSTSAGIATEAVSAGIATYGTTAGIATYSTTSGVSTQVSGNLGIAITGTNLNLSGITSIATLGVSVATTSKDIQVSGASTLSSVQISSGIVTASSGIVTYYGDQSKAAAGRWVLGADGTDHYTFTGPGLGYSTVNDPTLYLQRGRKYLFSNESGGHPFRIQSTSNGSAGSQWNVGVTNNDGGNGTVIEFEVPGGAPNTLYYQCTAHNNMGGSFVIYPSI